MYIIVCWSSRIIASETHVLPRALPLFAAAVLSPNGSCDAPLGVGVPPPPGVARVLGGFGVCISGDEVNPPFALPAAAVVVVGESEVDAPLVCLCDSSRRASKHRNM